MKTTFGALLVLVFVPVNAAYAEDCFPNVLECELSEWFSFLVGDIILAVMLGTLLYYLERRSSKNINKTTLAIQEILKREEESRAWRIITAAQSIKEQLNIILISTGLVSLESEKEKIQRHITVINRAAGSVHDTTDMIVGIINPKLIDNIYLFMNDLKLWDATSLNEKQSVIKIKIETISKNLDEEIKRTKSIIEE